jgi:crotonobetainyl-CoA:carnitine CoA-transferase CaiB-like acyl-CoA transferase
LKLEGLRVIDLSAFLPGPHFTMMMADHGADVIMVEPANSTGEPTRSIGQKTSDGVSVWFRNIARGKRSLKINLKDPEAREMFYALADTADVVVEAFRPGVVKRLGVDQETLRVRNPRLVYCSISAFGQDNEMSARPSHDTGVEALAGIIDLGRGLEDDKPAMPAIPFADASSSLMAFAAVMMALYRRETTGLGDCIDMSMYDACLAWTPNVTGPVFGGNAHPEPKTMRSFGGSAFTNLYETADGRFIALSGPEPKFVTNLLTALGRPDLIEIAKRDPGPEQETLRVFLRETFARKPLSRWIEFLEPVECAWAPVRSLKDAFDDPFTSARGMVFTDTDGHRHIGPPIRFADEPAGPNPRVPALGEHSEQIARDVGLSEDQIAALKDRGVI